MFDFVKIKKPLKNFLFYVDKEKHVKQNNNSFISLIIYYFYKILTASLRYTEVGREKLDTLHENKEQFVFCLWHDELFPLMKVKKQFDIVTVVSPSNDGSLLASVLERLDLRTVRGSSTKRGANALFSAVKLLKKEKIHACITLDGPLGPRHKVKDGAIFLAFHTNAHIVPVRIHMKRSYHFETWDKFQLPLPFSRVKIEFANPYTIQAPILNTEILQKEKTKLQNILIKMSKDMKKEQAIQSEKPFIKKERGMTFLEKIQFKSMMTMSAVFLKLGFSFVRSFGNFLGFLMWYCVPNRRKLTCSNIENALKLPSTEAKKLARETFNQNACSFLEIMLIPDFSFSPTRTKLKIAEPELFKELQECTRPIAVATAHIGAWELLAALIGDIYQDRRPSLIIARQYPNKAVHSFIMKKRESHGSHMIANKRIAAQVSRALSNNGIVGFLVDHNARQNESIYLNFLWKTAAVNMGPALLALRSDALVWPIFIVRDTEGYTLHLNKALDTKELEGTREEKVKQISLFYTAAVEEIIKKYPEQWFWMHNRWKEPAKK